MAKQSDSLLNPIWVVLPVRSSSSGQYRGKSMKGLKLSRVALKFSISQSLGRRERTAGYVVLQVDFVFKGKIWTLQSIYLRKNIQRI